MVIPSVHTYAKFIGNLTHPHIEIQEPRAGLQERFAREALTTVMLKTMAKMTASWILALGVIFPGLDHKFSDKTVKFLEMMRTHWMFGGVPMISNKFRSSSKLGRKRQPLDRKEGLRCPTAKKGNHSPQAEKKGLVTCNSSPYKGKPSANNSRERERSQAFRDGFSAWVASRVALFRMFRG
jgi:hypothetical protein